MDVADFFAEKPWIQAPTPGSLVDCALANGEVVYGTLESVDDSGAQFTYTPTSSPS